MTSYSPGLFRLAVFGQRVVEYSGNCHSTLRPDLRPYARMEHAANIRIGERNWFSVPTRTLGTFTILTPETTAVSIDITYGVLPE